MDVGEARAALAAASTRLTAAVDVVVEPWVRRCVATVAGAQGLDPDDLAPATDRAAAAAHDEVMADLAAALADPGGGAGTPLTALRRAVVHPTAVLRAAGARPVDRDEFERRAFPGDDYRLTPAAFEDVDPALKDPGLEWGAATAAVHLARRAR